MSERRTVPIICSRAPRHIVYVPAVRESYWSGPNDVLVHRWTCSFCRARVKVVA